MTPLSRFSVPIPMVFGPGSLSVLGEFLERWRVSRPLVVTDAGLRRAGILDRALAALGAAAAKAAVFDRVSSNPTEDDVRGALQVFRDAACDGVVALGGGSAIDAAKAVRLLAVHGGAVVDYDLRRGGAERITQAMPPLFAVPTTAGTGSEVSRAALIVTRSGGVVRKTAVASPALVPAAAILDPDLTVSLPPHMTAGAGMDALSHAVEEYLSPTHHPVVEALAGAAAGMIARTLPRVRSSPSDVEARGDMLLAAMMAGIGFEKGLGAIHSLSHAIGALDDVHHGTLNAVLLPHALELNLGYTRPGKARALARAVGHESVDDASAHRCLADWCRSLNAELGIPSRLRDLRASGASRAEVLALALDDHCHRTNPRPCGIDELGELWDRAW